MWLSEITGYPDHLAARIIIHAIHHGIRMTGDAGLPAPYRSPNAPPTRTVTGSTLIRNEIRRQTDKYFLPPESLRSNYIHSIGLKTTPEKSRITHNFSSPRGRSLNDVITYVAFRWVSIRDAASRIFRNCKFFRADIKDYYRQIPVDPGDWHLLAFVFALEPGAAQTEIWDCFMPFGGRHCVEIGHRISTFITWALGNRGLTNVFTVIDDILGIEIPNHPQPNALNTVISLLKDLGLPHNPKPDKTHDWATRCDWMGLSLCSSTMTIGLTPAKLDRYLLLIHNSLDRKGCDIATICNTIHKLIWAATVVWGISTHIRYLTQLARRLEELNTPWQKHYISGNSRHELEWISNNMRSHNGLALTLGAASPTLLIAVDARKANLGGCGGCTSDGKYFAYTHAEITAKFPEDAPAANDDISVLESYAILVGLRTFDTGAAQRIALQVDNGTSGKMARTLRGPRPNERPHADKVHNIAILIFQHLTRSGSRLTSVTTVPGRLNQMADALSRQQLDKYHALARNHDHSTIPS